MKAFTQVTSKKDQEQYWFLDKHYQYVPVAKFVEAFSSFWLGNALSREMTIPFDKCYNHPAALSTSNYGVKRAELLKISFSWQMLLLKRNSFVYIFKFFQVILLWKFLVILGKHMHFCHEIISHRLILRNKILQLNLIAYELLLYRLNLCLVAERHSLVESWNASFKLIFTRLCRTYIVFILSKAFNFL